MRPTAADLIERVIANRIADVRHGVNQGFAAALARNKTLGFVRTMRAGTSTYLGYPPELVARTSTGGYRHPHEATLLQVAKLLNQEVFPTLLRIRPSLTVTDLLSLLRTGLAGRSGGRRGQRRAPQFEPGLIHAAHHALMQENNWSADGADAELAARLGVHPRTIKRLRRRSAE
jgi:hypothetical protein